MKTLDYRTDETSTFFDLYFYNDVVRIRDEAKDQYPELADAKFQVLGDPFTSRNGYVKMRDLLNQQDYRVDMSLMTKV